MNDRKDKAQIETFRPDDRDPAIHAQRPIDKPPPVKPVEIGGGPVIVPPPRSNDKKKDT
jgi:hypothetical protein